MTVEETGVEVVVVVAPAVVDDTRTEGSPKGWERGLRPVVEETEGNGVAVVVKLTGGTQGHVASFRAPQSREVMRVRFSKVPCGGRMVIRV